MQHAFYAPPANLKRLPAFTSKGANAPLRKSHDATRAPYSFFAIGSDTLVSFRYDTEKRILCEHTADGYLPVSNARPFASSKEAMQWAASFAKWHALGLSGPTCANQANLAVLGEGDL